MKVILQRVTHSKVIVEKQTIGEIGRGLLVFLGIHKDDSFPDADYLVQKVLQLRIFEDEQGKMNLSAAEKQADLLVVSQFTLYGDCVKGRRPSFDLAAEPKKAEELYNYFVEQLKKSQLKVETGRFRAMMDVHLVNDGPVTFILDSRP